MDINLDEKTQKQILKFLFDRAYDNIFNAISNSQNQYSQSWNFQMPYFNVWNVDYSWLVNKLFVKYFNSLTKDELFNELLNSKDVNPLFLISTFIILWFKFQN